MRLNRLKISTTALFLFLLLLGTSSKAADVITNGTFDANITTGWTNTSSGSGTTSWDNSIGGVSNGSLLGQVSGRNIIHTSTLSQTVGAIDATDNVFLSLYWYKISGAVSTQNNMIVRIIKPSGDSVDIWTNTTVPPVADVPSSGTVTSQNVSASFNETGTYTLRLYGHLETTNNKNAIHQHNFDDIILDVQANTPNLPPVVSNIPGQSVGEGSSFTTIDLNTFVADPDNLDSEISWTTSGDVNLGVSIDGGNIATITNTDPDWNGNETITFTATDPGLLNDSDPATFTVTPINDPPVVGDIVGESIAEGSSFATIDLNTFVTDIDNNITTEINWTFSGDVNLGVSIDGSNIATITNTDPDWNGTEVITFIATDVPGGLSDSDPASFTVTPVNDPPVVTNIPAQSVSEGSTFATINLDDYVSDVEDLDSEISWAYSGNTELTVSINASRVAIITIPDINWNGSEIITFTATDLGLLSDSDPATFTVTPVNDPPTQTNGITAVSVSSVNRIGATSTVISATFTDYDSPAVPTLTATFKIREPNNSTELTLVNAQTNGNGGLTIIDNGDSTFTASYSYNPDDAQTLGLYDLYFEVTDGSTPAIDIFDNNLDELNIFEQNIPTVVAGATQVSPSTVNRAATNTTIISTTFNDSDQPGVNAFTVTFKVREPNNSTELTLVNAQTNGNGGLSIIDNGGGSYTASYTWDPGASQTLGDYDLYFDANDGTGNSTDDYTNNLDELNVYQQIAPTVVSGATLATPTTVNRFGTNSTTISADFTDSDQPTIGSFLITLKVREPNNSTELILVNDLSHGAGGLTVTANGGSSYTASYSWDPGASQTIGLYDLYFEVSDGIEIATDDYANNTDELTVIQQAPPTVSAGATVATVSPVARKLSDFTTIYADFSDIDQPGVGAFTVTIKVREPDNSTEVILANAATNGAGVTITDQGSGNYRAEVDWDPGDAQTIGLYDLYFEVSDGSDNAIDDYTNNFDELEVIDQAVGATPIIATGATGVSPVSINRIGANTTTISTSFSDADIPGVSAFTCSFKVREPNNSTEVILVNALTNGNGGLTISDGGGGNYTASYTWDPSDGQTIGVYDLYFEVSDGINNAIDDYTDNLDELTITSQAAPTVVAGATTVSATPVNRIGSGTTTISTTFTDIDEPAIGSFTINFKVREPNNSTELTLVNNLSHGTGGLTVVDNGAGSYTASYTWNPADAQTIGLYDLFFDVYDGIATATDDYSNNLDELELISQNTPTVVAGATTIAPSSVNRFGTNSSTISTSFTDIDQPNAGSFNVTFKIREPNNSTELTLVNALTTGNGGLTVTDDGGGNYTASYTWDPSGGQTIGLYDLYFEVTDGVDNVVDGYTSNMDELTVTSESAPTLSAANTAVSVSPVNRIGNVSTIISATFSDVDGDPVSAFSCTFTIREPNNTTELILVNALTHGNGGLTVVDNGNETYTASYTYNPNDAQTTGLYDLNFSVTDISGTVSDTYGANLNELEINEVLANSLPTIASGATTVSVSPVNRWGGNTTTISADFNDSDIPGIGAFYITVKIREPNNSTEATLVAGKQNGSTGLTVTDNGGGSYTASYIYNPDDPQTIGLYDLYIEVSDGIGSAIDGFTSNLDEMEINEVLPNNPPQLSVGATSVNPSQGNRWGSNNTTISAAFYDPDIPGINAYSVSFKIREPNNSTELTLVNNQNHGNGGLTIIHLGGGTYRAEFTYNPDDAQTLGTYDLYFQVIDGINTVTDDYANNLDELEIIDLPANFVPNIVANATSVSPSSVDRLGAGSTTFSATFDDTDDPGVGGFFITFYARAPFSQAIYTIADSLGNGQSGMSITSGGGSSYTATINWNPPDNAVLGYYDLMTVVYDVEDSDTDLYADNSGELLISSGGENIPPVVPSDNVFATPAAIERVGANSVLLSATFSDGDAPAVSQFRVTFKVREPDGSTEIILANNAANGAGVTISNDGGGIYTATTTWDPPDAQTIGFHDLYFHVTDQIATSYDGYSNNLGELEIIDAVVSSSTPSLVNGNTSVSPVSINLVGSEFSTISSTFKDADMPGTGAFVVTIKVRDQSSTEYTLVNAVNDGTNGLNITHLVDSTYQASLQFDPDVAYPAGTYDLYFYVQDNNGLNVTDGYTNNGDELTITSATLLGDGNLLRRTNDADACMSCHNIADHQTQNCVVCHAPHNTANIFLIREAIQTPSSGTKSVLFKTVGIGDAFNDPDPVEGDDAAGAMADDVNNVQTEVCEVCHTSTKYYRNDDSHTAREHHNDEDCTGCHPHAEGFAVSGGGESGGGSNCSCHSNIFTPLSSSTSTYHHSLNSDAADYTISAKTCLMCHVDHDIFRPDLNTGIGTRSKNLRVDITSSVTAGNASVLADYDYTSSGTGGICLSCHTSAQTKGYTQPDGTTETIVINKSDFDAATSSHNYIATSTFSSDGSTFNATCVKCHNDSMTKSYQNSTNKFSEHDSEYRRILMATGVASPSDPLEEDFCFQCHSQTTNPNAGSNQDYYAAKGMTATSLKIEQVFGYTTTHPTNTFSGRHKPGENGSDLADGNRHAECVDCHDVHRVLQGTHDGSSNLVSNALKGTWGVEPTSWPSVPTPTDNANLFAAPASFTKLEPAQKEYQICLKCHSNYTTLPSGGRNLAEEINPNYPSSHAIVQAGDNPFCNTTTMNEPWGTNKINYCSDCHSSNVANDPKGPHGSNLDNLLVATIVSDNSNGTPLCDVCHKSSVYWTDSGTPSDYDDHPSTQGQHLLAPGCFSCHMWDHASTPGLGLPTTDWPGGSGSTTPVAPATKIWIHGQNRKWVYNEQDGSAGSGQPVENFINGYIANMDHGANRCWTETCKVHSNKAY